MSSWFVCVALYTSRSRRLVGLTDRVRPLRAGYAFLANKYYLDDLYEKVIVRGIAGPIARAAYWINQHVIDGIVNGAGRVGRMVGNLVYRNIDQRVVDGAVDGAGVVANETGSALQPIQSGQGQPVRCAALRGGCHRRRRPRDRERVVRAQRAKCQECRR